MNEIERIETIIFKLNDRLTIQEKEFVHLRTYLHLRVKVETNEIKEKVIIHYYRYYQVQFNSNLFSTS